jgi:hypothetical protein
MPNKFTSEIHTIKGTKFHVYQDRFKNQFPYSDLKANPILWFGRHIESNDLIVTGVNKKFTCLSILEDSIGGCHV